MSKFKTYKKKDTKTYTGSKKKNRKEARAKRILAKHPAVEEQPNISETPKSLKWVETHFPQLIKIKKSLTDVFNKILSIEDDKRNLTQADKLNAALDYASDKFGNRNDYAKYLTPIIGQIDKDLQEVLITDPKSIIGDHEHFTVDDDFDGNLNNLFKYIHFKDIPSSVDDRFIENILDLEWSTPDAYNAHVDEINKKIYASNLKDSGIDITTPYYVLLESVMQSSAAWKIAARNALDSDQVKDNWYTLYSAGMEAVDKNTSHPEIFDKFVQMIENEDSLDNIVDKIDEMLIEALKE